MVSKFTKYVVAVSASLSLCSCGDVIESIFMDMWPYIAGGTVRPHDTYLATWEIDNQTSRPMEAVLEYRYYMQGKWNDSGSYTYDLPVGKAAPINYTSSYADEEEYNTKQNTKSNDGDGSRVLLYDKESRELIYVMDYDFLTTPGLWVARWQDDPVPGDYLYQRGLFQDDPELANDDKFTFIYWTFTLTDEHLAEYAAQKDVAE